MQCEIHFRIEYCGNFFYWKSTIGTTIETTIVAIESNIDTTVSKNE